MNLLVAEDLGSIKMDEVQRVLVPGGVAMIKDARGKWQKNVKPRSTAIDEWSHYLHDASGNAVAHDKKSDHRGICSGSAARATRDITTAWPA